MLPAVSERDPAPAHRDVARPQRGNAEGPVPLRIALGTDPEPAEIDEPHGHRADALVGKMLVLHVFGHRLAELRQVLREPDEPVVLRLLLALPECVAVPVLLAPRGVDAGRLDLRAGAGRDPDIGPRGRNGERANALELCLVRDLPSGRVDIAKAPLRPRPAPPPSARHPLRHARRPATSIVSTIDAMRSLGPGR